MMRLFLTLLFIPFSIIAQRASNVFTLGVKSGMVFTEAVGAKVNTYQKKSYVGGLTFRLKLAKKWTGEIQAIFIEKGSKNKGSPEKGYIDNYILRLQYVEFPVLFQFHQKGWTYFFGPGFGYLVQAREFFYDGRMGNGNLESDNPVTESELSFNIGISHSLGRYWELNLQYTNSVLPVRGVDYVKPAWYKKGMLNSVLAISLTRNFRLSKNKSIESETKE